MPKSKTSKIKWDRQSVAAVAFFVFLFVAISVLAVVGSMNPVADFGQGLVGQRALDISWNESVSFPNIFYLDEGEHELVFRGREAGTLLDKIEVVPLCDAITDLYSETHYGRPMQDMDGDCIEDLWEYQVCECDIPALELASPENEDEQLAKMTWRDVFYYSLQGQFDIVHMTPVPTATVDPSVTPTQTAILPVGHVVVAENVEVGIYYRGEDANGKAKALNERLEATLYNFSDGYRLPFCDYVPEHLRDLTECSQNKTLLRYVVEVTSGQPYDIGYWGAIVSDEVGKGIWIALYIEELDTWFTDWRPDEFEIR